MSNNTNEVLADAFLEGFWIGLQSLWGGIVQAFQQYPWLWLVAIAIVVLAVLPRRSRRR